MRTHRFEVSDPAIVGGAVLLLASFLPWYGLDAGIFQTDGGEGGPSVTAWQSSAWWVPVCAGVAVASLWGARRLRVIEAPWLPAVSVTVGLAGLVVVLSQALVGVETADFGWFAHALVAGGEHFAAGPRVGLALGLVGLAMQTAAAATALRRDG